METSSKLSQIPFHNPWFTISIGLMGIMLGYVLGTSMPSSGVNAAPLKAELVAQKATAPTPTPKKAPPPPPPAGDPPSTGDNAFLGEEDALVTFIEFTDYQCPFCKRHFDQTFGQIKSQYVDTGKVKYVVRDFPLGFHQFAQKASEATECAEDQGKFWEMHDTIFQNQSQIDVPSLKKYAGDLGLKQSEFDDCLDTGKYADEVIADMKAGQATGISGTPGFWVIGKDGKGEKLSGAQPFTSFKAAIDRHLN